MIFGSKVVQRELPPEQHVCPNCLSVTEHTVTEFDTRFTLYFIPLFSIKRDVLFRCSRCGDSHLIPFSEYQATHAEAEAEAGGPKPERKKKTKKAAEAILEGRVVNGKVEDLRSPFKLDFNLDARTIQRGLWIALGLVALLAILLVILLVAITAR
jgi:hypothetical protein